MAIPDNPGQTVNTGGGASIGGSVTAGRDFVGRDQVTNVTQAAHDTVEKILKLLGRGLALAGTLFS